MLHTYIDPFAVEPAQVKAEAAARLRRTIATLNAEVERLDDKISRLYSAQGRLPNTDGDEWDDVWNDYDRRIARLIRRSDAMALAAWQAEERLYWGKV